jgi:hypothetical protein
VNVAAGLDHKFNGHARLDVGARYNVADWLTAIPGVSIQR